MKVSYTWLQEYVDCPWSAAELADRLTMAGLKVEGLARLGEGLEAIRVGEVERVEPHPSADNLYVAEVRVGPEVFTIVTGAKNVRAKDRVPVAPPGSRLPDGRVIETVTFRGVPSQGMMCSESELQLGRDASGIMILPPDTPVGKSLQEALMLDDWVLELEIYPNRPDCLGVIGIAREVAALCQRPLRLPADDFPEEGPESREMVRVSIEDDALCRRYIAHLADSIQIRPSPLWMQQRLRAADMRPINNAVDITNYVMLEWGQPLHAFDFRTLRGGRIIVRRAREGEEILTLDGQKRSLTTDMLVIADAERPVAVAGVMGGGETEVTEDTPIILLEAAHFHAASVRRTSRQLGLRTEASHRFEKGLDPELAEKGARRALSLLNQLAGARIYRGSVDVYPRPASPWKVSFRPNRVNRLLGVQLSGQEMARILERLGFEPRRLDEPGEERWEVTVPTFRTDVQREADLAEEIIRLQGFDTVPATLPRSPAAPGGQNRLLEAIDRVREVLVGCGLMEAITYSFVSPKRNDWLLLPETHPWRQQVRLRNPLSEEHSVMRTNLLGGLLDAAARNASRRIYDVHLFEIGAVYLPDPLGGDRQPMEPRRLGLVMCGALPETMWGHPVREADFFSVKGVLEQVAQALRVKLEFRPSAHPSFHPGRQAEVLLEGRLVGLVGEVHPRVLEAFEAPERTCAAEIDLEPLVEASGGIPRYKPLPRYPLVRRDLALLVPVGCAAAQVEQVIREVSGQLLDTIGLFDVYEGKQVPQGFRSVAYTLGFRSDERTLTDEEVTQLIARIEEALEARLQVHVRR